MGKRTLVVAALLGAAFWLGQARLATAADEKKSGDDNTKVDDKTFVMKATQAGLAEMSLGMLAARMGMSEEVRRFAQRMVDDHKKANRMLAEVAGKKFTLPREVTMDDKHRTALTQLAKLKGADFDRTFIQQMVKDHEKAVSLFEAESKNGKDESLRNFASKALPTLRHHLEMARKLAKSEGGGREKR
jgi:putative membrane protein